ncbi:hypothetical protein [Jiulongibacter sediminis]|mgnify:CR=1 FL=1|jgi:hypothetical protein|uniref:hypothetical protein n=1 Tax=Jiulongibacter sediminis TaxID=1605367 RepID=UPI0026ECEC32|nr:hypothetical protein [Jiulongibacter sediminis]
MSSSLKIRLTAFLLSVVGIAFLTLYLMGYKPAFLQIPVFALASTYAENRFVQMVQTNAIDEIGFLLLTAGLALMVFNTFREDARDKRLEAFEFALKYSLILAAIAYVLVFGYAIFGLLMALFPVFVVLYLIKFELLKKARN